MTTLRYDLKLQVNAAALVAMAIPAFVPLALNVERNPLLFAELFFPTAAPLLMAHLFSREWEGGTADVLLARPRGRGALLAGRLLSAVALLVVAYLLGWAVLLAKVHAAPLPDLLAVTLPGGLAMGALGLAVATAARSSPAGYLVPLCWWLLDWLTMGRLTWRFYLFDHAGPEKWWLVGLAAGLTALTLAILHRRDR